MNPGALMLLVAALTLCTCSGMLADQALKQAQEGCSAKGMQFLQDSVHKHDDPIFSSASVSGHCVPAGDAGSTARED
jgi:hypothetical protein